MKIPVTIVTGFLGSGKTTLICNLLRKTPDRRLAVLVNEFGEVSVDGALLRAAGEETGGVEVHDLPNGCICCTVKDDFLPTMKRLQQRRHEIDHVVIETSGLALPTPVMRALSWPEVRNDFQLDAVLAVIDTPQLLAGAFEAGAPVPGADAPDTPAHAGATDAILNQQLENADVAILNKIDALDEDALLRAEDAVRARATKLRFVELAYHAELDTRLCLGLTLHAEPPAVGHGSHSHHPGHGPGHDHGGVHQGPVGTMPRELDGPLADQEQFDGHVHSGLGSHQHGNSTHAHFHEHDPGWQSFVLRSDESQDPERMKEALREVTLHQPVLRAKGFAAVAGKTDPLVLQVVRHRIQTYFDHDTRTADETAGSSLVFIGYHPDRSAVAALLERCTGTHWG